MAMLIVASQSGNMRERLTALALLYRHYPRQRNVAECLWTLQWVWEEATDADLAWVRGEYPEEASLLQHDAFLPEQVIRERDKTEMEVTMRESLQGGFPIEIAFVLAVIVLIAVMALFVL